MAGLVCLPGLPAGRLHHRAPSSPSTAACGGTSSDPDSRGAADHICRSHAGRPESPPHPPSKPLIHRAVLLQSSKPGRPAPVMGSDSRQRAHLPLARTYRGLHPVARGCALMVLATFMFAGMHTAIRYTTQHLPPVEVAFFRNLFGLVVIAPLLVRYGLEPVSHQEARPARAARRAQRRLDAGVLRRPVDDAAGARDGALLSPRRCSPPC